MSDGGKFMWDWERDLIDVTPADAFRMSFSPEPGVTRLVRSGDELIYACGQKYPDQNPPQAYASFLLPDESKYLPEDIRREAEAILSVDGARDTAGG